MEHGTKQQRHDGNVKVKPIPGGISAKVFPVIWGNNLEIETQFDVRFKVGNGEWKNWAQEHQLWANVFGAGDEPVNVKPGKTYEIQARTENVDNEEKRSGWSPTLKVEVET